MKAIKYDWFEFGVFGVFKADELPLHRDELKKYGQNWFMCRIIEGEPNDVRKCTTTIEKVVMSLNSDDVKVIFNPILGVYEFLFVKS